MSAGAPPLLVGRGLIAPFNHAAVFLELIFPLVHLGATQYAWLEDDVSGSRPLLVPSGSITEFALMGTFEDYLGDEMHDVLGPAYLQLIWLVQEVQEAGAQGLQAAVEPPGIPRVPDDARALAGRLTPPSLLRCVAMLHREPMRLVDALRDALAWGDLLRSCDCTEQRAHALDLLVLTRR